MPTIYDVAVQASVSPSTVSHVLNGTRFVEPATKDRVLAAIEQLKYRPNSLARSLRRRATGTIGLVVPDNSNPFFADVARAIEDVGFAEGYNVILGNSDLSEAKERAYIDVLLSKQVDGLILIATSNRPHYLEAVTAAGVPVLVVDRELTDLQADTVLVDNAAGGYLAGQYLVGLGHRRIGCIAGQSDLSPSTQRVAGFQRALRELGLPPAALAQGDFRYASGVAATHALIDREPELTALFAANDLMAIGALNALHRRQIAVPRDISLIGFDNIVLAAMVSPELTTVGQPVAEIGRVSAKRLIARIRQPDLAVQQFLLTPQLIERETCRAWQPR